ncbi:hypothetical protein MKW94_010641 [Papaver nudicaule]|uniref:Cation/H+ exchanger domain-containing protein n=1 Tax=Papaver nudicaule TaxID=74823 RepID=A0AA42AS55_PAPNU|nr:hypothetical protein [Papaver nudicaule]
MRDPLTQEFNCVKIKGMFEYGYSPFIAVQIGIYLFFMGTFHVFLGRLHQIKHISSVFAGIVLGPVLLGSSETFQELAEQAGGKALMEVISNIALVFFTFLVGVKTDMDMITKASRSTLIIGFSTFVIPLLFNDALLVVVRKTFNLGKNMSDSLVFVTLTVSSSSFYDTACAVADLDLLNSEIGRLGLAISIITGLSSWLYDFAHQLYVEATSLKPKMLLYAWLGKSFLLIVIVFILRPLMSWMNRSTPEGKTLKEGYVSAILLSVMGTFLYSQTFGIWPLMGPVLMGLMIPVGSPIAAAVQKKLECFVIYVLLPSVYIIAGYHVRKFKVMWKLIVVVEIMMFLAYSAKVTVLMTQQTYTIMIFTNLLITMVVTPTVKHLYDPSRKYAGYKRQTIPNSTVDSELRILACVYNQDNVPSILNFLEATNPVTKDSFVCVYVLHLVEQVGRAASLLIEHKQQKKKQFTRARSRNSSEKIINAFHQFELQHQGYTIGQCYTAISPFSTMDNDVSQIAFKKRTNLVIIPFGELDGDENPYRAVNRSVLHKAPCSVGIIFHHKNNSTIVTDVVKSCHNVAMIFIGGVDDREALTFSMRMADKPNLNLTVFRFTHRNSNKKSKKDDEYISDLWQKIVRTENIVYKEEEVTDCADTASKIKCLDNSYDFIIVGRRHESNSPVLNGLDEWCVFKELGLVGDLFASSKFQGNFSVLVMQQ